MLKSRSWTLLGGAVELLPPEAVQGGVGVAHEVPLVDVDDLKVDCLAAQRSHLMMRLWCTVPSSIKVKVFMLNQIVCVFIFATKYFLPTC